MSRTLIISDELYARLETEARSCGHETVEHLLSVSHAVTNGEEDRGKIVEQIDRLRQRLHARFGKMPDSVNLIREDRAR